jgi:sterol 3beta-glucosyltransferase
MRLRLQMRIDDGEACHDRRRVGWIENRPQPVDRLTVGIVALGTRGDVQPPAALAAALSERGHRVRFLAPADSARLAESHAIELRALSVDVNAELSVLGANSFCTSHKNPIIFLRRLKRIAQRHILHVAPAVLAHLKDCDVMVGTGFSSPLAMMAARRWGKPCIHAWMQPVVPSRNFTTPLAPPLEIHLPRWMNRLVTSALDGIGLWALWPLICRMHEVCGLTPPKRLLSVSGLVRAGEKVLLAYSEAILPRDEFWPKNVIVTGYWYSDQLSCWQPPPGLSRFLDDGPPPVYIGFGSMVMRAPAKTWKIISDVVAKHSCRAVFDSGWSGMQFERFSKDVVAFSDVPHGWLFPRTAAIVHHGGAGTTGAALRAGKPSIVVPFMTDQFFWARRLEESGLAPRAIPHAALSADGLDRAMGTVLGDRAMRQRAAALGAAVRSEKGVARAVEAIESAALRGLAIDRSASQVAEPRHPST